jgi:hypothetical protein
MSRFCELNGNLSFIAMQRLFSSGDVSYKHIISLLLSGSEHYARKNKLPFDYTDIDSADWIDEIGGLGGEKAFELLKVIGKAINPDYQGVEVLKDESKKKEESLAGSTSELSASTAA